MGREPDQVGISGEGPIRTVAAARSRIGGERFSNQKNLRDNPKILKYVQWE